MCESLSSVHVPACCTALTCSPAGGWLKASCAKVQIPLSKEDYHTCKMFVTENKFNESLSKWCRGRHVHDYSFMDRLSLVH